MSLKHLVLAVVAEGPAHGYEIHARLAALSVAPACDGSRVYAILADLASEGRLRPAWEDAGRGRTRKRYRLEAAGERDLARWLARPRPSGALLRRDLLVRLAAAESHPAGGSVPWAAIRARLVRRRDRLRRAPAGEDVVGRLLRRRELARLDAEIAFLGEMAPAPRRRLRA